MTGIQIYREAVERKRTYALHHGRSHARLVRVIPDDSSPLYRIAWPDGLSPPANLTRCRDAAERWAEQRFLTDHRKMNDARRLKSLDNFSWSTSPMRAAENSSLRIEKRDGP